MEQHIETTRRQLGELGTMAAQTEAMERQILERAEKRLDEVQAKIDQARTSAAFNSNEYMGLVEESGRLKQVIAHAMAVLSG